jgi:hypothetical protein
MIAGLEPGVDLAAVMAKRRSTVVCVSRGNSSPAASLDDPCSLRAARERWQVTSVEAISRPYCRA